MKHEETSLIDSTVTYSEKETFNKATTTLKTSTGKSISEDVKRKKREVDLPNNKFNSSNVGSTDDSNISTTDILTASETTTDMSTIDQTTLDLSSTTDTVSVSPTSLELSTIQNEQISLAQNIPTATMQTDTKTSNSNELSTMVNIDSTTLNIPSTTENSVTPLINDLTTTPMSSTDLENIPTDFTTPTSTDAILTTEFSSETISSLNNEPSTTSSEIITSSTDLPTSTTDLTSKISTDMSESIIFNQSSTTPINKGIILKFLNFYMEIKIQLYLIYLCQNSFETRKSITCY